MVARHILEDEVHRHPDEGPRSPERARYLVAILMYLAFVHVDVDARGVMNYVRVLS